MVVDLPAPLGPRKPWTSPGVTVRSSPSSARVAPKVLTRSRTADSGLPPTPILTVRDWALTAALHPANVPYLFYVTGKDGVTRFSTTQSTASDLHQLSQNGLLRTVTNSPTRDIATIVGALRRNREEFFARERAFIRALVETRGLTIEMPAEEGAPS